MRHPILFLSLAALAACGGGNTAAPTPPPPPPPASQLPGPPASLTMTAGDGQTAAPGAKVAVHPSVVVRDASGRVVSNVGVTFSVEAGGGAIEGGSTVTGGDGIASSGDWTLGPAEGQNRIRVTSGSLPPVVFGAEATFPTVVLAETVIGPGGGTIAYHKAGDPLDGTQLVIPNGAFAGPGHWRIEARPGAPAPGLVSGRVNAVLQVTTDQGLSDSALFLTLPLSVPADSFPTVFLRDPATGRMEAMPPVSIKPASITVAARHFSAGLLLGSPAPSAGPTATAAAAPLPGSLLQILLTSNSLVSLSLGIGTGFLPGTDDWEFPNNGTYLTPNGNRVGSAISELLWFQTNGPQALGLNGMFDRGAFWADDDQGVRVAALAEQAIDWAGVSRYATAINAASVTQGFGTADAANLYTMAAAMTNTRKPQLIIGLGPAPQGFYGLVAYQLDQTGVTAADPNRPGVPIRIPFANGHFQPVQLGPFTGAPTSQFFLAQTIGLSSVVDPVTVAGLFTKAAAGTAGAAEFPQYKLQYYDEETTIWLDLTTTTLQVGWQDVQIRAICLSCARSILSLTQNGLQAVDVYDVAAQQLASDKTAGFVKFRVPANGKVGIHVLGGYPCASGCAGQWRHVDFKYITIQATRLAITPDPVAGDIGQNITFTVKNLNPGTPPNATYEWDFGDGTTKIVTGGDSTVTKSWTTGGNYTVKVVVKNPATGQTYGRVTAQAAITVPVPVWRFLDMNELFSGRAYFDYLGHQGVAMNGDIFGLMEPIRAVPVSGRIFYFAAPFTSGNQTFPAGVYVMGGFNNFTDISFSPSKAYAPLARAPQGPSPDAFTDALVIDAATLAGSLTSGTFSGKSATRTVDLRSYKGVGGVHTLSHWEFTGTKNGVFLQGTITYYLEQWNLDANTCVPRASLNCQSVFGGTIRWDFPFTALRVR